MSTPLAHGGVPTVPARADTIGFWIRSGTSQGPTVLTPPVVAAQALLSDDALVGATITIQSSSGTTSYTIRSRATRSAEETAKLLTHPSSSKTLIVIVHDPNSERLVVLIAS